MSTTGPDARPLSTTSLAALSDEAFAARVRAGDVRAGARLMRWIDDRHPRAEALLKRLHADAGRAHLVGITGNPGAGKSTLVTALVAHWRAEGRRVGVVAVDPSSPFSGGAILGDRIRMAEHSLDDGVFIRSVATRGHLGGLSRSASDIALVMDAMGYDPVVIETVGVGQDEIDVIRVAHTTAVVVVPGLGDEIQAIKAGLLEIADIFVLNKADREGAQRTERDLRMLQSLGGHTDHSKWEAPILRTVATSREGIETLAAALFAHRERVQAVPDERARSRARHLLESLVRDRISVAFDRALAPREREILDALVARQSDPWTEAERLFELIRGQA